MITYLYFIFYRFFKDNIGCIKFSDNLESSAPHVGLFLIRTDLNSMISRILTCALYGFIFQLLSYSLLFPKNSLYISPFLFVHPNCLQSEILYNLDC